MIRKIITLPKDIQRLIVSYVIPRQNNELLEDIRDFTESLHHLKKIFLEITYGIFGDEIIHYSQEEIHQHMNFNILHKILIELMYTIPENQYFFCNFIPLFMVKRDWITKYQKNIIGSICNNNLLNIKNRVRFIFGIMKPENRNQIIDYYSYIEEPEEEDYDW